MTNPLNFPTLPHTVHIIGCGPSANGHLDDGNYCIALNGAILWPRQWDEFMAFDLGVKEELWWDVDRILERAKIMILGENFKYDNGSRIYKFPYKPTLHCNPNMLSREPITDEYPLEPYNPVMPDRLRGTCSIAGCAVQRCALGGAKVVHMVGVDMNGTAHTLGRPPRSQRTAEDWPTLNRLRRLVLCVERDYGMTIHWNRKDG